MSRLAFYRTVAVGHFVIAVPLLLFCLFFGIIVAPVLIPGPVWLCMLGAKLWNGPNPLLTKQVWITHAVSMLFAVLLIGMGIFALQAAERSAAHGGGLLGTWGLIPIAIGSVLALLSIASIGVVAVPAQRNA
jgi:hypothetical protein